MDDPYYSYAPLLITDRPIALVGFMGAQVPLTGASLAMLTGLPYIDLERQVEHSAGCSIARLVQTRGLETFAAHERRVLKRVLRESPAPIIALSHASLMDRATRQLLTGQAEIFYIQRSMSACFQALHRDASRCWALGGRPPATPDVLEHMLGEHLEGYATAQHTISARGQHPHRIAAAILEVVRTMQD